MSQITAKTVNMVKQSDGSVTVTVSGPNGDIRYVLNIPAADFTSFNTTVNGGSTGASLTKVYGQISKSSGTVPHDVYERD